MCLHAVCSIQDFRRGPGPRGAYENVPLHHGHAPPFSRHSEQNQANSARSDVLYAKPVPRNLRRKFISENIYANQDTTGAHVENIELNVMNSNAVPDTHNNDEAMYANQAMCNNSLHNSNQNPSGELYGKVVPKNQRTQHCYVNVDHNVYKTNDPESEYVQPIYSASQK